ncbi:hypothetical protein D3C75_671880 [compost metagenome]
MKLVYVMARLRERKRSMWISAGIIAVFALLLVAFLVVKDFPGSYSDWRLSRALGLQDTLRIPLEKTPEAAVQQFRHTPDAQIIHRERVKGGMVLFLKRPVQKDGNNLQVEYVRKTWFGWKWVWGGGYGIGGGLRDKVVLNYMSIPEVEHLSASFPLVFGDVLNPSVSRVLVKAAGKEASEYPAIIASDDQGHRIWYTFLPSSVSAPFEIEVFSDDGRQMAHKEISDPYDSGTIELN